MQDNNTLPKINMVFHGEHSSWVFGKMLRLYQEAAKGKYTIIPSIDPRPGCDVYQYWRPMSPAALKGMRSIKAESEYFTKGIQMMHDSPYDNLRHKTDTRLKTLANYKYIMCTSQEQMNFYSDKVSLDKLKYLPLGVFTENCIWHTPRTQGKLRIGFIGRYYHDRVKGEDLVTQIAQRLDPSKFEFVVRCPNNQLLASRLKRLRFTVLTSGDYDVLLVCSKFEGTPLPLLEAMASGIYVLSTRVGESPVLLDSNQLCDNHSMFVSKLKEIEQNRQLLVDAMPVLKDKVKDRTWERFINDSMALWDSIINDVNQDVNILIESDCSNSNENTQLNEQYEFNLSECKNKTHVLVVNINNITYTKACVYDLLKQNIPFDLTIIDQGSTENNTKNVLIELHKEFAKRDDCTIRIKFNGENRPLNHVWNDFYVNTTNEYLCFLNNDVRIPFNFLSDNEKIFNKEIDVGAVVHATNHPNYRHVLSKLHYDVVNDSYFQGWDFTFKRTAFTLLPKELKVYYGDDYLFEMLYKNKYKLAYALSSPMIHYCSKSAKYAAKNISANDAIAYKNLGHIKRLVHNLKYVKCLPTFETFL